MPRADAGCLEQTSHTVTTTDGVRIACTLFRRPSRHAVLILCHGFFQSQTAATFQRLAQRLSDHCDVLAMDFRGHGRSTGLFTFSAQESRDLEAVLALAQSRYPRIGVMGFSLGAATAINTVSRHPELVQSLIAVSGPSQFDRIEFQWWRLEAMRTGLAGCQRGAGCRPGNLWLPKERPVDRVRAISPVPTLFIHGTRDVIVGVEHSRRLFQAAGDPKRLEIIDGGSHAEALFRDAPEAFLRLVSGWIAQTLGPAGGAA